MDEFGVFYMKYDQIKHFYITYGFNDNFAPVLNEVPNFTTSLSKIITLIVFNSGF